MNLNKNIPVLPRRPTAFRDADKIEHMLYRPLAITVSVSAVIFMLVVSVGFMDLALFSEAITNYILRNEFPVFDLLFRTPVGIGLMAFLVGTYHAFTNDAIVTKDYLKTPISLFIVSRVVVFFALWIASGAASFLISPIILIVAASTAWLVFLKDLSQVIFEGLNNNIMGIAALITWPIILTSFVWILTPYFRIPRIEA